MVKKQRRSLENDTFKKVCPYSFRTRKPINYSLLKHKTLANPFARKIKKEIKCELDNQYDSINCDPLNLVSVKQEFFELSNHCIVSNNPNISNDEVVIQSIKLEKELLNDIIEKAVAQDSPSICNISNEIEIKNELIEGVTKVSPGSSNDVSEKGIGQTLVGSSICTSLNELEIKKELVNDVSNISTLTAESDNLNVKIKEEPLSQNSFNCSQISEIEETNDFLKDVMNVPILLENDVIKIKEEKLSPSFKTSNQETPLEVLATDSSIIQKKRLSDYGLNGSEKIQGDRKKGYNQTCAGINSNLDKTISVTDLNEIKYNYKVMIPSQTTTDEAKLSNYGDVKMIYSSKSDVFVAPQRTKNKVVLVKREVLSQSETERIEKERDNACIKAAAKTGAVWRRLSPVKRVCGFIPKVPDVIPVYTPAGQRFELHPNEERPDEFPDEEDRENWDHATRINVLRVISDIETGSSIPSGVNVEKEMAFKELIKKWDEDCQVVVDDYLEENGNYDAELRFFQLEEKLLKWDHWVKTRLPLRESQVYRLTNELISSQFHEFIFIKNFHVIETIKKAMEQKEYLILKQKASVLFSKIQNTCKKTKHGELEYYIRGKASKLLNICKDYPLPAFHLLTPGCKEAAALYEPVSSAKPNHHQEDPRIQCLDDNDETNESELTDGAIATRNQLIPEE